MPKQYGSNGINSDGSLMNVGNTIWDPNNGGKPSIKLFPNKNANAITTPPWLLGFEEKDISNKDIIKKPIDSKNFSENKNNLKNICVDHTNYSKDLK